MYCKYAPIIPYIGMGNVLLGDSIDRVIDILKNQKLSIYIETTPYGEERCTIDNEMLIVANSVNRKICMMCALEEYQGILLKKIHIGMTIPEIMEVDKSLIKVEPDDDYVSFENGYFIEHELFDFSNEFTTPVTEITIMLKCFFPTYKNDKEEFENSEIYRSGRW